MSGAPKPAAAERLVEATVIETAPSLLDVLPDGVQRGALEVESPPSGLVIVLCGCDTRRMHRDMRIMSLHRYWMWADCMRSRFDAALQTREVELFVGRGQASMAATMHMSLWYALLYTVVEGWRRLSLSDPQIDALLGEDERVGALKRYRHGVAHFQPNYLDKRFIEIMEASELTVPWVRDLHEQYGRWFLGYLRAHPIERATAQRRRPE